MLNIISTLAILIIATLFNLLKGQIKYTVSVFFINIVYASLITLIIIFISIYNIDLQGSLLVLLLVVAAVDSIVYINIFKR